MEENINKPKKIGIGFYFIIFGLITFLLGFYLGTTKDAVKENKDLTISVDYELQTFRTEKGFKLYPIEYKGNLYIPYNGLGSFLNYMTIKNQETGNINLITLDEDFELKPLENMKTEDYNGEKIDSSVFNNSEYTALFVIASWCPECKDVLKQLKENNNYFSNNNIQILTVVVDAPNLENKEKITDDFKEKIYSQTEGVDIAHYLFSDSILSTNIIGNSVNIPKMIIFDKDGYLVKIEDYLNFKVIQNTFNDIFGYEE